MTSKDNEQSMDRRGFIKASAAAAVVGSGLVAAGRAAAAVENRDERNFRSDRMPYRKLGRTNFMCSRLVFGCGAALRGGHAVRLLERSFEAGVNCYDVGYNDYYKGSEAALAPFFKEHRGDIFVVSKAPARMEAGPVTVEKAKGAAAYWTKELDKSLGRLQTEYVDAYYYMGVNDPEVVKNEELHAAFLAAQSAGKVGHLGISTHQNAQECLEAAIDTGWFSLAMIAITPAGWYDYRVMEVVAGKGTLTELRPVIDRARDAGIGLVGMKAARHIATGAYGGKYDKALANESFFDSLYSTKFRDSGLNAFQRSYAYVLGNGLDVVNSDMQNFRHFEENLTAARTAHEHFA